MQRLEPSDAICPYSDFFFLSSSSNTEALESPRAEVGYRNRVIKLQFLHNEMITSNKKREPKQLTIQVSQRCNKQNVEENRIRNQCSNANPKHVIICEEASRREEDFPNRRCIKSGICVILHSENTFQHFVERLHEITQRLYLNENA